MWATDFDFAPAPRRVSLGARLGVLCGGVLPLVGWGLLGFGSLFVWLFGDLNMARDVVRFAGTVEVVSGRLTGSGETSSEVNEQAVYAYEYEFTDPLGVVRRGLSYQTWGELPAGKAVEVEFPAGDPAHSRIRGARSTTFPPWILLFVGIFPGVGAAMVAASLRRGLQRVRLLREGDLTEAKLVDKRGTNVQVNEQTVFELTFQFERDGKSYQVKARTHEPAALEDEPLERVLFLPADPSVACLVDELPGDGYVDEAGGFRATGAAWIKASIVPALVLALNGFALLIAVLAAA